MSGTFYDLNNGTKNVIEVSIKELSQSIFKLFILLKNCTKTAREASVWK